MVKVNSATFLSAVFAAAIAGCGVRSVSNVPTSSAELVHRVHCGDPKTVVEFVDSGSHITVIRGDSQVRVSPPNGHFWAEPVVTSNGHYVFVIANEGYSIGGYSPAAVYRIAIQNQEKQLQEISPERMLSNSDLHNNDLKEASVTEIYAASDDGNKLLVMIGYTDTLKSREGHTYTSYRPCFLDVRSKEISIVQP